MDVQESFLSHLIELRTRLIRAIVAVGVLFVILFIWPDPGNIYDFVAAPLMHALPQGAKMIATGVVTPFIMPVKLTALVAFMIALPYVLYQLWAFIAPGLYEHEKRFVLPLVVGSTVLFLIGVAFCYYIVFGRVFHFINMFAPKAITPAPDIENYLNFVMTMFLAFGAAFELPIVVIVLVRMGIVSVEKLKAARPYVIVGVFVLAAVITPPDALSQLMLAIPMCLLFEIGLLFARMVAKQAQEAAAAGEGEAPMSDEEMERELER